MDNITFLVNGTFKNKAKVIENIRKVFSQNDIEIVESQHKEHLTELAYRTVTKGITKLVVVGGDGSTNEVVNGIAKYAKDTTLNTYNWEKIEGIKLGILPCGTGNDFTKTIHITNDMDRLKTLLDLDQYQKCDIGSVDFLDKNQKPAQRFFMNITDVGMGGIVVEKLEKKMPFFSRSFRYNLSISSTFLSYDKALVRAESKDFTYEGKIMNFIIANGKYFGNGLGIAPEASVQDGKFNIVILGNINFIDYMKNLNEVKKCKLIHHEEVKYFTTDELQVNSPNHTSLPIDMDGEFIGYAPLQARNISKVINIYM
jgi:YegS/Rv2252/BmrU family lipid kinase